MIPLLREEFFVALASNAKKVYPKFTSTPKPVILTDVSLKNARRVARMREQKEKQAEASYLLKQVHEHKEKSNSLQEHVTQLHERIVDHTSGKQELVSAKEAQANVDKLASLQDSLDMVKNLAVQMHDQKEISSKDWSSLSDKLKRLSHLIYVQKAAFERDAQLLHV